MAETNLARPRDLIVLGDSTLGGFVRELNTQLGASGHAWGALDAGFDSWERELFDPASATGANAQAALGFILSPRLLEGEAGTQLAERVRAVLEVLAARSPPRTVLFANMFADPRLALPLTASLEHSRRATEVSLLLSEFSQEHSWFYVIDHVSAALQVGIAAMNDPRYEALGGMYFSPAGTRHLAALWARALSALAHVPAKVLVVDLDNVLWGGILGEDGADGIAMARSGRGFFFRRFQEALRGLRQAGVLLAVCSKNNPTEAETVLASHPDCLLRPADFAAMEISWDPKSVAIQRLAKRLNLGLDAFVFVDDSPFERAEVSAALPQVRVLDFPAEPSGMVAMLEHCTAFDRLRITAEDRLRAGDYAAEARRESLRSAATTPAEFFRSLLLRATLRRATAADFERLHQLLHKTNQFNLTCERLDADEFRQRLASARFEVYAMRVADRFGDSGLVGLAIVDRRDPLRWSVENFLLSCRVIGRTVEHAFIAWLAERAAAAGAQSLVLRFVASARNQVAREFLGRSGFSASPDESEWSLDLAARAVLPQNYVEIVTDSPVEA